MSNSDHERIAIVPATEDHIEEIAARMRAADRQEVFAARGVSPHEALEFSLQKSAIARTALVDGKPEVMFGVADLNVLSRVGAPWLLGTDAVEAEYRQFLRRSIDWRGQLLQRYDVLRNLVDERNAVSVRWLKWLGFRFLKAFPVGDDKLPFWLFEMRRGDV